jgi:hypothetical protein
MRFTSQPNTVRLILNSSLRMQESRGRSKLHTPDKLHAASPIEQLQVTRAVSEHADHERPNLEVRFGRN